MISRVYRATLLALYQLCVVIGIAALPLAIATRQVGFTLPVHRLLARVGTAYENATTTQ